MRLDSHEYVARAHIPGSTSPADTDGSEIHTLGTGRNPSCAQYAIGFPPCKECGKPNAAGWGTALKPAWEPIILARKPLVGTVAENVIAHGTGALNVDGCRIPAEKPTGWGGGGSTMYDGGLSRKGGTARPSDGRWPANILLDEQAAAMLDEQSGNLTSGKLLPHHRRKGGSNIGTFNMRDRTGEPGIFGGDSGGASRFFFTAKASSGERHYAGRNTHTTVKPVALMRWLCRLVTPPRGIVLDPFMGSGSTGVAALAEGFRFLGIELSAEYLEIAKQRIAGPLFT